MAGEDVREDEDENRVSGLSSVPGGFASVQIPHLSVYRDPIPDRTSCLRRPISWLQGFWLTVSVHDSE
jgi:hypothetical protein